MANTYFSFKRFTVHQAHSAMKVGTDGVLLGAWCMRRDAPSDIREKELHKAERWLDVGTGTGVIALMLAQRFAESEIDALEPDVWACEDARTNFGASPWETRLHLIPDRLQDYVERTSLRYDYIVTNPPFFVDSLPSPDDARTRARHAATLPYDELLEGVRKLLKEEGAFSLILPPAESRLFSLEATARGWWLQRRTEVCSTPNSGIRRVLMQWGRLGQIPATEKGPMRCDRLTIHTRENTYSDEYRALTRDFYLRF